MIEAIIVSRPKIDFQNLFLAASQALGRTISDAIDAHKGSLSDPAKMISAITNFSEGGINAKDHIRGADHELLFLHYTFLCHSDRETFATLREWTKLDLRSQPSFANEFVFFAAGTVAEWKRACLDCCTRKASFNLRLLFDKIVLRLETEGIGDIWFETRKKSMPDQTFLLEKPK